VNRRGFLRALLPAAVAAPILIEEALDPKRVYFLPPRVGPSWTAPLRDDGFQWVVYGPEHNPSPIAHIIETTLRKYHSKLAWNVTQENALLHRLMERREQFLEFRGREKPPALILST
jgi:hypothetical protein